MNKELPVYHAVIDPSKLELGIEFVSLVAEPAIMEMGLAFAAAASTLKFAIDRDKQIIVGPAMIPDLPLYRNQDGQEFYVVFTRETIEALHEKFSKEPRDFKVNVDHSEIVQSAFIKSSWIIEDPVHDKSVMYGLDLPVGTLMMEIKIEDATFWVNEVKDNGKYGFSVEGMFDLQLVNNKTKNKQQMKEEFNASLLLADLSPEQLTQLKDAIAAVAPEETVAEITDAVTEVIAELPVVEIPVEAAVEAPTAPADAPAPTASDEQVAAAVAAAVESLQAQIDELAMQIAEMKSEDTIEDEIPVAFSKTSGTTVVEFIKHYNRKFNI
jgi:hypothetical protein